MLALRTYGRYVVPLTIASIVAYVPLLVFVLRLGVPDDADGARQQYLLAWALPGVAWFVQLALVGAAHALIAGNPTQRRAIPQAIVGLGRTIVPVACVAAAVAVGSLALVLPGLVLVVLLALTGASDERGLPAPLLDSIATVRAHWLAVTLAVAAILALDAGIAVVAHAVWWRPLAKQPTPDQLAAGRTIARVTVAALAVISPLPACVLAALKR